METRMQFTVLLEEAPEGGFTAKCVEIPGAISEGETQEEALENVADAIRMILQVRRGEAKEAAARTHSHLETVEVNA